jgi:hypothetical protein
VNCYAKSDAHRNEALCWVYLDISRSRRSDCEGDVLGHGPGPGTSAGLYHGTGAEKCLWNLKSRRRPAALEPWVLCTYVHSSTQQTTEDPYVISTENGVC